MTISDDHIRSAYDSAAQAYATRFLQELDHKPLDRRLLAQFADSVTQGRTVIDLGCGPGHTTAHLASLGLTPMGVDLSPAMIDLARSHFPNVDFAVANIFQLPYKNQAYDGCLAFYCLVNSRPEELESAFREIWRVLKDDGLLLLSFHVGDECIVADNFLESGSTLEFFPFPKRFVTNTLAGAGFVDIEAIERPPYETEYPSHRCYVFARRPHTAGHASLTGR